VNGPPTSETSPAAPDVGPEEASALVGVGAHLLDVREDEEWQAGHAPAARHVPMGQLPARLDEVPADRTVICVCRVGARSGAVATALMAEGFDVRNLAGGMLAWEAAGLPVVTDGGGSGQVV
jgi:rhodanese-related sulfurtransferase